MNIATHLARTAHLAGDRPAVAVGGTVVQTYASLHARAVALAGSLLRRFGLPPGARVALAMRNCPEYLELLYACWHAGLVAVPINAKLHPREFRHILEDSGASLCFTTADITQTLAPAESLTVIEAGSTTYTRLLEGPDEAIVHTSPDDVAWLFYTSGTTGKPKGAMLSHRNLLAMSLCYFTDVDPHPPWSAILHAAPLSHGSGLYALPHVMKGSCHVIPESGGFDPAEICTLLPHWPGLVFFAAPTMVHRLVDYDGPIEVSNLKAIIYGGGPMYVDDCIAALNRLGPRLTQLYGQGESPMTITALNRDMHSEFDHPRWRQRLGSVGVAQSAVQVQVVDDAGTPLPTGEVGEIVVRGDTVMRGYWQNPEATAATIRDGWLYTGDCGCFDAEGFLTLKDRTKDLIISGGTNIYPREIEEVLIAHPDVAEAAVVGTPDREWGERVVAYVVARPTHTLDVATLERHCLERMARFKRPRDYRFVDALPKNNYGKVVKRELRALESSERAE